MTLIFSKPEVVVIMEPITNVYDMVASDNSILFFTGTLAAGGLERFVTEVCIEGARKGYFSPKVICLQRKTGIFLENLNIAGIEVIEAPHGWQRRLSQLFILGRRISALKPKVVHSQVNFSLVQQFLLVGLFSSAKFMVTERNCYPISGFAKVRRIFQFYFLKLFGVHYSANSEGVALHLSTMVHYPVGKIPIISNGIRIPAQDPIKRQQLRARYGWKDSDLVVGYVSRFANHKGHRYFLEVMHCVKRFWGAKLKVCFIGDGPTRKEMEFHSIKLGIDAIFLGVIKNVDDFYASFDCTALLSDFEGMPNVVVEAMAHGLPVIANSVGNVEELFRGNAGILNLTNVPEETARLFVDLGSVELRREIGQEARKRITNHFSLNSTLDNLMKYYGGNE